MTIVKLPENVVKVLSSSSKVEAGLFSKKPLTNKEVLNILAHYGIAFKNIYRKYLNKVPDSKLLSDTTFNMIKEVEESLAKEKSVSKEKKPGFFKRWKSEIEAMHNLEKEADELSKKYQDKIHGQIMCQISSEVFEETHVFQTKYTKNSYTEALRKDLTELRKKYENLFDLHVMNENICERLWDGEDELEYEK